MRYIIETNEPDLIEHADIKIIEKYEPIEKLTAKMEIMKAVFEDFKKNQGNWNIMVGYLRSKGIAKYDIDRVFAGVEDFLEELED